MSSEQDPSRRTVHMIPVADELRRLNAKRILIRAAEAGYITELACAMPTCYCPMGRRHFADAGPDLDDWMPTFEHIVPKRDGGRETVDNGILAHRLCNRLDYAISDGRPHERDLARIRRARDELERKSPRATRADSR